MTEAIMLTSRMKTKVRGWVMKWLILITLLSAKGAASSSWTETTGLAANGHHRTSINSSAHVNIESIKTSDLQNLSSSLVVLNSTSDNDAKSVNSTSVPRTGNVETSLLLLLSQSSTVPTTAIPLSRETASGVASSSSPTSILKRPPVVASDTGAPEIRAKPPTAVQNASNESSASNKEKQLVFSASVRPSHQTLTNGEIPNSQLQSENSENVNQSTSSRQKPVPNTRTSKKTNTSSDTAKTSDNSKQHCKNCSVVITENQKSVAFSTVPTLTKLFTQNRRVDSIQKDIESTTTKTTRNYPDKNSPTRLNSTNSSSTTITRVVTTREPFAHNASNKTNLPSPSKDTYPHQNDPPWHSGPNVGVEREKQSTNKDLALLNKVKDDLTIETSQPFVKLGPEWHLAKVVWGVAWEFHVYFTGVIFVMLSIYSLVNILRLQSFPRILSHGYFLSLNFMIFLVCSMRAVYLLHDAYNSRNTYPMALSYFLLTIPYPVLSSAFAVLFLGLLEATRVQMLSPRIQKPSVLGAIILFYVSFSTTTDIVAGSFFGSQLLIFVCQILFMTWSLTVSIAYFFVFRRLYIAALRKQGEMIRITFTQMHIDGATLPKKLPKPTLGLAVKVALITAILELFMAALQIYSMIFVYGIFVPIKPDPWPWWAYQMTSRLLEIAMCTLMAFITTQPLKNVASTPDKYHKFFDWVPCNRCWNSCCKTDSFDIEAFSSYCSRHRGGFHNGGFHTSLDGSRRWDQTNSLPAFPTYSLDQEDPFSLKSLPAGGKSEIANNPPSVGSLLSTFRSNRNVQAPSADGASTAQRGIAQGTLVSSFDGRSTGSRPTSMLFKDKGFVRFRTEDDPVQPMDLSDDEESSDSDDEMDSVKANASSSIPTLCEDDIVHSSLSPFYYGGFHPRFHRMSRCSLETTDNSVDVSSDQLSNVTSRNGLSNSALDFHMRKYGSTCSSESAANSFDVTFFLHGSGLTPNHSTACRSELDDSSVDAHDAALRSVSPLISRVRRVQQVPRDLNITPNSECCGQVNVACGTEDITPDSAVVMDVQFSEATSHPQPAMHPSALQSDSPVLVSSCNKSSISHSLNDLSYPTLRVSSSDSVLRTKRASRSFLNRLKGSSFSLNASLNGYEPLECDGSGSSMYYDKRRKVQRSGSDRLSSFSLGAAQITVPSVSGHRKYEQLRQGRLREADSGMIRDCTDLTICVDKASQTEMLDGRLDAHIAGMQCNDMSKAPQFSSASRVAKIGTFSVPQEAL